MRERDGKGETKLDWESGGIRFRNCRWAAF